MRPETPAITLSFERSAIRRLQVLLRKLRFYVVLEGVAHIVIVGLLCVLCQIGLDYLFRLRVDLRAALLLGVLLAVAWTVWRWLIDPLRWPIGVEDVAAAIERRFPDLEGRLISAVQFARPGTPATHHSPALIASLTAQAEEQFRGIPADRILNHKRARLHSAAVCAVLALAVAATLWAPQVMGTWFERNVLLGEASWKQHTYLIVLNDQDQDGIIQTPRGDDLLIRVRVDGRRPRQVNIDLRFASQEHEVRLMTAVGQNEFRYAVPRLNQALSFQVRGGDDESESVTVQLVDRPRLTDAAVTVYPPAYTREAPYQLRGGQTLIKITPGSDVELRFRPNKPLRSAVLVQDQTELQNATATAGGYLVRFQPQQDATYYFRLTDTLGLTGVKPRRFAVRMVPDEPPRVSLSVSDAGDLIVPRAVLPLAMTFKDRFGLAGAELAYTLSGETVRSGNVEIAGLTPAGRQLSTTMDFDLADVQAQAGTRLTLHAQARDQNDVTGPGIGTSSQYSFRVVTPEALLAELRRREQELRQEFEQLIEQQEKLRGDLLSAATVFERDVRARSPELGFTASERRQREITRQAAHVGDQFQRIHGELRVNQLDTQQVRRRLIEGIVNPLEDLAGRSLLRSVDQLEQLQRRPSAALLREADAQQRAILQDMRRILASMSNWEGFHETIALLQTIIKMQEDLQSETEKTLNTELDEIFGGESEP